MDTRSRFEELHELIVEDLIHTHLNEEFSLVAFNEDGFDLHESYRELADYNVECCLRMPHGFTEECVETPNGPELRWWRRIKGGPVHLLENGYLSVKKVRDFYISKLKEVADGFEGDYDVKMATYGDNRAIHFITVKYINDEQISVALYFSVRITSFKDGHLDLKNSYDLLALPFDLKNENLNTDLWPLSRRRVREEGLERREREIHKKPKDLLADKKLIKCLEEVEMNKFNSTSHRSIQKKQKEIVKDLVADKILGEQLIETFDAVVFAGGSYEMTAVPRLADYDLECCLRMVPEITYDNVEKCGHDEWRKIRGGPQQYLEGSYLSIKKVRDHVYSGLKKAIQDLPKEIGRRIELEEFDKGSAAIKMVVDGDSDAPIDIDLVICVRAVGPGQKDILNAKYFIAKPRYRENPDEASDLWRISTSVIEKLAFESLRVHKTLEEKEEETNRWSDEKSRTYKIMKLVKRGHKELSIFPSFLYKQVFMLQYASYVDKPLYIRFKEFIYYLWEALEAHQLTVLLSEDRINILDRWEKEDVEPAKSVLRRVIDDGAYYKLLEPVLDSDFKLE